MMVRGKRRPLFTGGGPSPTRYDFASTARRGGCHVMRRDGDPRHCHGFGGVCRRSRGRSSVLLARSAGVHVDFHADRHFHDLRSFPSHSGSPKVLSATSRGAKPRAGSPVVQAPIRMPNASVSILRGRTSLSGKASSLLVKHGAERRDFARHTTPESTRVVPRQQSLPAVCVLGLAPPALSAAVGWLCICRWASSDEAAAPLLARFIVLVGGC